MSDDQEQLPHASTFAQLRTAMAGRNSSISANVAIRTIEQMPRNEALSILRVALEESTPGEDSRLAVIGALGRLGGDEAGITITSNFAALSNVEAIRAARGLALTAGVETLSRLAQIDRHEVPKVQAALNAAQRLIAFRTGTDINLPVDDFTPNLPLVDAPTVSLQMLSVTAEASPPERVVSAVVNLIPSVTLSTQAIRRVNCIGSTMWLATNEALANTASAQELLAHRSIVAVLAQYDGCGETTYARYLIGYDPLAREMLSLTPDGRITHAGPTELEGMQLRFTLSASSISRAFSGEGSFDLMAGALDLSGNVNLPSGANRDDPSAIKPINQLEG